MRLGVEAALVDGRLVPGDVAVDDGRIAAVGLAGPGRGIAAPGFVDLQVNGFARRRLPRRRRGRLRRGRRGAARDRRHRLPADVHHLRPRTSSSPRCARSRRMRRGARILGAHLEGPFISPHRLGTHPRDRRRDPDPTLLERLLAAGPVRLVTLAPELPGALELVDLLLGAGRSSSRSGTATRPPAEANAAFDRGVRTVTHVFNAMRPLTHRDPGIVGAALLPPDVVVQAIVDGIHLDPDIVRLLWNVAAGRVALVTDAIAGAGLGRRRLPARRGRHRRAQRRRPPERRRARRQRADDDRGRSQPRRDSASRSSGRWKRRPPSRPACSVSTTRAGSQVGGRADVVVLDDDLEIQRVIVGGETRVAAPDLGADLPRRDRRATRRARAPARARATRSRRSRRRSARAGRACPHGRAWLVRQRGLLRRLRLRPAAALDRDARLDHAHRPLRHAARPLRARS